MSEGWDGYKPAPIEVFHGEAMEHFHRIAKKTHGEIFGKIPATIDGIQFNRLLAEFKVKVMKEYGISSDPIKIEKPDTPTKEEFSYGSPVPSSSETKRVNFDLPEEAKKAKWQMEIYVGEDEEGNEYWIPFAHLDPALQEYVRQGVKVSCQKSCSEINSRSDAKNGKQRK